MSDEKGIRWLPLCILLAAAVVCGLPALAYPFGKDQGTFALFGRLILDGAAPYLDAWDIKPPGIFYIYAIAEALFGHSMSSIRLFDIIWQTGTMFLVYAITRRISKRELPAVIAGVLYIASYWIHGFWNTAQSDGFINLPIAAAILLFLGKIDGKASLASGAIAGICVGIAFYFKYPAALIIPALAAILLCGKIKGALSYLAATATGFCAVVGGYLLYLQIAGALQDFLYIQFSFVPEYMKVMSNGAAGPRGALAFFRLKELFGTFFAYPPLLILSLASYAAALKTRKAGPPAHLVAAWGLVSLVSLYLQGKFYIYHFLPLLAPLSIGASFAFGFAFDESRPRQLRRSCLFGILAVFILSFAFSNPRYRRYCVDVYQDGWKALAARITRGTPFREYRMNIRFTSDDFSYPADRLVADYIMERTRPHEKIYIWGFEPIIYWMSERRSPSPFIHNFALRGGWSPKRYSEKLLSSLREDPPLYFLVVRNDPMPWMVGSRGDSAAALARYPELTGWLDENYRPETAIDDFVIYKRKRNRI